jgi:hypothetical protein
VRARRAASVVLAAVVLLSTAGCTFFTPQTTLKPYDPSDGVGGQVGNVQVRNAIILTKDGEHASLLVNLINDGDTDANVKLQYDGLNDKGLPARVNHRIFVGGGDVTSIGAKNDTKLYLTLVDAKPGTLFPLYFQYGSKGGEELLVPVLDGTLDSYKNLLPTPRPSVTPTPAVTPTPTSTPTK